MSKRSDCKNCPARKACIGKSGYKILTNSLTKPLFDDKQLRMKGDYGKQMMVIRKSTVEPVIANLIEYLGMSEVNTIGIKLANKCMIMAGIAYNLKKLIKYQGKTRWYAFLSVLKFRVPPNPMPFINHGSWQYWVKYKFSHT